MQGQEADQDKIDCEQHPGENSRPRQDQMDDEDGSKEHAGLPRVEPDVVALVLKDE